MHIHTLDQWQHSHNFSGDHHEAESKTKIVLLLTVVTMMAEIGAGIVFGSMALLADGWHMATHVAAFGIAVFTYQYARSQANNPRYTFGTGKVSILGGFTSAVVLAVIAFIMALESTTRFFQPQSIQFSEAIYIAILGLVVNIVSALLLDDHHDHHNHEHHDDHDHHSHAHHQDYNLRAAYIHVLADAITSVLAIIALCAGKFLGWIWLDAVMGIVGAVVIAKWSYGLARETGSILVDGGIDNCVKLAITKAIEEDSDNQITDLHVWNVSQNHLSATIALVTHYPQQPQYYKELLQHIPSLSHVLIEVNQCHGEPCLD
ncbi:MULTISPECIES: CDF family Co(II)/Ni(II) efflux transporter DmeF [Pseudanabaena]|uniref:Cation diffusion facilitator family transporter n=2 Tax=Pseudanabaena TaxID=1152 RepID=L8MXF3_9CYAN|nr:MULTISPECIES: CDF family Co(II)/Ni(II) efflux transporter DmeF [Pseudanabaena]ELS30673.1 cation diffusion facilitator family transporter [Pseudanabaena biceps PCC 7429]MDG3497055.1 CDF family Co(II)/Ni(II) efflux transporter DmeF [Pseudanabaena catenata USMAC16]